jgi:hypothetical protein
MEKISQVPPAAQLDCASTVDTDNSTPSVDPVDHGPSEYKQSGENALRHLGMRAGVLLTALILLMALAAGPVLAQDGDGSGSGDGNPAMDESDESDEGGGEESNDGITGGLGQDTLDEDEEDYTGENSEGDSTGDFAKSAADGELLYKTYPITKYEFAFYQPESKAWQFGKKLGQAVSAGINQWASALYILYVIVMTISMALIQAVLSLNLVENMSDTVSEKMSALGNTVIGNGGNFTAFVKLVWALGVAAIVFYLFRSRVSRAFGALLQMIVITAISVMIISSPGQVIQWYTGITNSLSNTVLAVGMGEDAAESGTASMPTEFANTMWENYVILPWAQIQVSSDPGVAKEYGEQALATDKADRPDALEGIKDKEGVDPRASETDSVMHVTWALTTLIFGLIISTLLIIMAGIILVAQIIALVAILTSPIWLWFAIFPAGGVTSKMFGWFLGINIDVILLKLILGIFLAVNSAILTADVDGEEMLLVMRFILSILSAVAVIMLVMGLRAVMQEVLSGRSGFGGGGSAGMLAMRMASDAGSKVMGESKSATGGSSGARGSSYMSPVTSAVQGGGGGEKGREAEREAEGGDKSKDRNGGNGGKKGRLGKLQKEKDEARRAQYGEKPIDDRNKKQKAADIGKNTAKRAGSIGWKATKTGAGAAGATAKVGASVGKRLPKAGMMAAKSGFMPMETAAAFGGLGAAAGYGAAAGAMGRGKEKVKEAGKGILNNAREAREESKNAERFTSEGEEMTEQRAETKASNDRDRYDKAEEAALQEYQAANPQHGGEYPEEAPQGMPENGKYHPEQGGIITGSLKKDDMPPNVEGYTPSVENLTNKKGQSAGRQYTLTPNEAPGVMRSKAFENAESARPDGPRQEALDQQQGIVASGYSNYDKFHADKLGQLKKEVPKAPATGESQEAFETRRDEARDKVQNYNPAQNAPPPTGDTSTGKVPGAAETSSVQNTPYPSVEEIKKIDPEGFKKFSEPRLSQEFKDPLQRSAVEQSRSLAADPNRSRGAYDVTYYMEHARADVAEGIRRGDSNQSIITGMNKPESQDGAEMKSFHDRARDITNSWQKHGPVSQPTNGPSDDPDG